MKKFTLAVILVSCYAASFGQALFNNNGANIYVTDGGFVMVNSDSGIHNIAGSINNQGTIQVVGYVKNDASIIGNGDTIRLEGDWINNSNYTGNNSWVDMYGATQMITGSAITTFDNLNTQGGSVLKRQTLNAITSGLLQLNDAELGTDVNQMLVTNTDPDAITRNSGFVSSVSINGAGGMLARVTGSSSAYLFPTGSPSYTGNTPSIYRPVEMTPASSSGDTYGACLVYDNATNEGYNVNQLDSVLCKVNPKFYHRLYRNSGTDDVALAMFFNAGLDGDWSDIAHWENNLWNDVPPPAAGSNSGLSTITVPVVSDFTPNPFALASRRFTVTTGAAINITEGESTTLAAVLNRSGSPAISWSPDMFLSCDSCLNPVATPDVTTLYTITVTDGTGCSASDSILVNVLGTALLVPTGFSPNNDGVNDLFRVLNKNLTQLDLQVYDRWGNRVFESTDPADGWDGTYKNAKEDIGVYVWQCTYMLTGDTKTRFAKGNVTLIR